MAAQHPNRDPVTSTFDWFERPPDGPETMSKRRAHAWLATVPARIKAARITLPDPPDELLAVATDFVNTEHLPEWKSHDEAVAALAQLLESVYDRLQRNEGPTE